jgi:hypothetical protein
MLKKELKHNKCSLYGTTFSIEINHKNEKYDIKSDKIEDYQALCKHCNDRKREICKKCLLEKCSRMCK